MGHKKLYTLSGQVARKKNFLNIVDLILQSKNQNHNLFWWILQALIKKIASWMMIPNRGTNDAIYKP